MSASGEVLDDQLGPTDPLTPKTTLFGRGLLYVVASSIQMVVAAVMSPVLAHLLGDPAEFGRISSAIALHQLLVVFACIGLDQAIVLRGAEDGHDRGARALASAAVLIAVVVTSVLWATSRWWASSLGFDAGSSLATATIVWTVPAVGVMASLGLLLTADRLAAYTTISLLAVVGGQTLGVLLVLFGGENASTYMWALVMADTGAMLLGAALARPRLRAAFSWTLLRPALVLGLPLMLGSLSSFVLNAGDRIVILRLLGAAEVGRYQIAYTVGFVAVILIQLTSGAWTPQFAAIRDAAQRWVVIAGARDSLYRVLSPVTLGVILGTPVLLRIVAPASFAPSSLLVVVLLVLLTAYPMTASSASGRMLITEHRTRSLALWALVAAVLNVVLNLVLVPVLGITGAAAATVIAFASQCVGQRLSVGHAVPWPRTPPALLVQVAVVILLASLSTALPQTPAWNLARFALAVGCLPWFWLELKKARSD